MYGCRCVRHHRACPGGLDELPGVHDRDIVRDRPEQREVVADVEATEPELVDQPAQELRDPRLRGDVETRRRLVEDQHVRIAGERDRQRDALLLAAAELKRVAVERAGRIRQSHRVEQLDAASTRGAALSSPR